MCDGGGWEVYILLISGSFQLSEVGRVNVLNFLMLFNKVEVVVFNFLKLADGGGVVVFQFYDVRLWRWVGGQILQVFDDILSGLPIFFF